jgi:hypothetical protein
MEYNFSSSCKIYWDINAFNNIDFQLALAKNKIDIFFGKGWSWWGVCSSSIFVAYVQVVHHSTCIDELQKKHKCIAWSYREKVNNFIILCGIVACSCDLESVPLCVAIAYHI